MIESWLLSRKIYKCVNLVHEIFTLVSSLWMYTLHKSFRFRCIVCWVNVILHCIQNSCIICIILFHVNNCWLFLNISRRCIVCWVNVILRCTQNSCIIRITLFHVNDCWLLLNMSRRCIISWVNVILRCKQNSCVIRNAFFCVNDCWLLLNMSRVYSILLYEI